MPRWWFGYPSYEARVANNELGRQVEELRRRLQAIAEIAGRPV